MLCSDRRSTRARASRACSILPSSFHTSLSPLPARPKRARRLASAPAIMNAASTLFVRNGYLGTSMDDIAALAGVSKQTVYTHFADKQRLFAEVISSNTAGADEFAQAGPTLVQE